MILMNKKKDIDLQYEKDCKEALECLDNMLETGEYKPKKRGMTIAEHNAFNPNVGYLKEAKNDIIKITIQIR